MTYNVDGAFTKEKCDGILNSVHKSRCVNVNVFIFIFLS